MVVAQSSPRLGRGAIPCQRTKAPRDDCYRCCCGPPPRLMSGGGDLGGGVPLLLREGEGEGKGMGAHPLGCPDSCHDGLEWPSSPLPQLQPRSRWGPLPLHGESGTRLRICRSLAAGSGGIPRTCSSTRKCARIARQNLSTTQPKKLSHFYFPNIIGNLKCTVERLQRSLAFNNLITVHRNHLHASAPWMAGGRE